MRCLRCGKLLQSIFAGIASDFKNITEVRDKDGYVVSFLVCNNPDCEDGKLNASLSDVKNLPF